MKYMIGIIGFLLLFVSARTLCQNTSVVYLNEVEQERLQKLIQIDPQARYLHDSIENKAFEYLNDEPKPVKIIYFEGMLETDTARIRTRASLLDMDKVSTMFYASFGKPREEYGEKIKEFVLAWASRYEPTGNTINENKFVPLLWGYYIYKSAFTSGEQALVEDWITAIGNKQMQRSYTPNNNWQAKRLRLLGLIGGITGNQDFIDYAIRYLKEYIGSAYYPDGTSNDLKKRDALHYHVSGLKPMLTIFINLSTFDPRFDLYDYESPTGASIEKSIKYTVPYATGEKVHEEWVHTQVELDKRRAAAGIPEYQPGILFDKTKAFPLFEFAVYYNPDWFRILSPTDSFTTTWIGMLNSPLVRE